MVIHPQVIEHHIHDDRAFTRLCDGDPAGDADISSEDMFALRDAGAGSVSASSSPRVLFWEACFFIRHIDVRLV